MLKREINGVKLEISEEDISTKMADILKSNAYETNESKQIPRIVQNGDVIIELGGGIGYISTLCHLQKKAKKIVVFEANPELIPIIEKTHALNGVSAEVINAVVLPEKTSETVPFYIRDDFWASSLSKEPWSYKSTVEVPVFSLNDVVKKYNPTMLIVDIEGGETHLFGENPDLTGVKKIYMELHQNIIGRIGMKRIFDTLSSKDFHYDVWHSENNVVLFSHVLR